MTKFETRDWYEEDAADALRALSVDASRGLSEAEAARRLAEYGPNELVEYGVKSPWRILREQMTATMVVLLLVATVVSALVGDYKDALVILALVFINALLGFSQEYRAERAMAALKRWAVPTVKVRRDGHVREVSARELVPGDIVALETGDLVPADGRLLESVNLRLQEAVLTGESEPVEKEVKALKGADLPLGDRRNMAYMGTTVAYGHGQAVVTATGMRTELGRIAAMLQTMDAETTPLQRRLNQLGRQLAVIALGIVGVIFALGLLRGEEARLMFLTAISIGVAAVPEGLPAVVTIALALGAQRMHRRHALIRKLSAVETLGSVTVICSDKTGTLTENRMTVTVIDVAGHRLELRKSQPLAPPDHPALLLTLVGGALCNDAVLEYGSDAPGDRYALGDPTEGALLLAAAELGLHKAELEPVFPRVTEAPFDSQRKRMTTVHRLPISTAQWPPALQAAWERSVWPEDSPYVALTKGAVDSLLEVSGRVWVEDRAEPLDATWRQRIAASNDRLARNGTRVLGIAVRPLEALPSEVSPEALERDLIFVGLVGMIDPPRRGVREAVETCKAAGIRPVMITGDHPLTARYIAAELGITEEGRLLTGQELTRLSVEELQSIVEEISVYARVSPEHKLKIVQALQHRGHVVAMTGDGVNDAPALKKADIGVAMGVTGTDVSKETAAMVLLDDNFTTIVAAVKEGRVIYDNIRKFVRYLMTSNSAELWVMLLAPFLGMPLPLLPLQILWINLVTDGPTALALGFEPAERGVMRRRPYPPGENIFARGLGRQVIWVGLLMGLVSLGTGLWYWYDDRPNWQTMVFTVLTLSQLGNVLATRSERDSLFRIGLLSNKRLLVAVVLTFLFQLAVIYVPLLQALFSTKALSASDLCHSLLLSSVVFWGVEIEKWLTRRRASPRHASKNAIAHAR